MIKGKCGDEFPFFPLFLQIFSEYFFLPWVVQIEPDRVFGKESRWLRCPDDGAMGADIKMQGNGSAVCETRKGKREIACVWGAREREFI